MRISKIEQSTVGHPHEAISSAPRAQDVRADPGVPCASHPASPAACGLGTAQQGRADPDVAAVGAADDAAANDHDTATADDACVAAARYINYFQNPTLKHTVLHLNIGLQNTAQLLLSRRNCHRPPNDISVF